jgi:hypothetical protein
MRAYAEAGYAPIPLRHGRPAVSGVLSNSPSWRYYPGAEHAQPAFAECSVGLLCSARPLSGARGNATLAACSSSWIAGVRVVSPHKKLRVELADIIERVAGAAPCRTLGDELLYVFKVARPFIARRVPSVTLPGDNPIALKYVPTRVEVLSVGAFCDVSGGTWRNGSLPETRRDELPLLTAENAHSVMTATESLYRLRGATPWT